MGVTNVTIGDNYLPFNIAFCRIAKA